MVPLAAIGDMADVFMADPLAARGADAGVTENLAVEATCDAGIYHVLTGHLSVGINVYRRIRIQIIIII